MSRRGIRRMLYSLSWVLAVVTVLVFASAVYLLALTSRLPDLSSESTALGSAETSTVYAADGSVLDEWYDVEDRKTVPLASMRTHTQRAVVAIEDRRFYEHNGVDFRSIARALRVNATAGEVRQGGSTITQQTVKLLFTDGERTLKRKIEEALLAIQLESRADKDEVLGVYLNTVYFGRGAYGVESAARRFFGVSAEQLSLAQSALLAGCIQSPTRFDPFVNPADALERRNIVLKEMREQGYISREVYAAASAEPLGLQPPDVKKVRLAPYFVEYVRRDLIERLGAERLYRGGLRIHTTLEPQSQLAAEAAAQAVLPSSDDPEVAIASVRWGDGAIVALVGGRDFALEQFDLATQGKRQTGSAFKPFVLAAALEEGFTLDSVFDATPFTTPVRDGIWQVDNYETRKAAPRMTLRAATVHSVNTVYARLIMRVGPEKVVDVAQRMGITTPIQPEPAIALGGLDRGVSPLEMASAFGTIANKGTAVRPTAVTLVTDATGEVVYRPQTVTRKAISEAHAAQLSSVLHEAYTKGTGSGADFGQWGAVKTGTAQSWRDAWIVGTSGDLSTAVWVGYPQAQVAMTNVHGIRVTGGSFPATIWKQYMRVASTVPRPATSVATGTARTEPGHDIYLVCSDSLKLASAACPNPMELVLRVGSMSTERCGLEH